MIASESMGQEWVIESPEEILVPEFLQSLPTRSIWNTLLLTIFSVALAKILWKQPLYFKWGAPSPFALLFMQIILEGAFFFYALGVIREIMRWVYPQPVPFRVLMALGAVAFIPLHLTLPLALLCRPLGEAGTLIFIFGKLAIWTLVLQRFVSGLRRLLAWPAWAAGLVVLSPLFLTCATLMVAASIMVLSFSFSFLALLR